MISPRRTRLLPLVLLVLVATAILEVWLLIRVGEQIGALPTVGLLLVAAGLGAWLTQRAGHRAWTALNGAVMSNQMPAAQMPARELTDAALLLGGGLLLIVPGFATDVIGLLCVLPGTRVLARRLLRWLLARRIVRLGATVAPFGPDRGRSSVVVIEGETVDSPVSPAGSHDPQIIAGEIDDRSP